MDVPHLVAFVRGAQNIRTKVKVMINGSDYKPSPPGASSQEDRLANENPPQKNTNNFEGNNTGHLMTQTSELGEILIVLSNQYVCN